MKILKAVSAVTALSMTVTGLAVAASANSATSDDIANALGNLTRYGIVAETLETYSHFETNFAVKEVTLNNNFDLNNAVSKISRTIRFTVKTEESFIGGETKEYYFGIFCDGEMVGDTICVSFAEEGTKTFVIEVPTEYKYKDLAIYQLELITTDDGKLAYATADNGTKFYSDAQDEADHLTQYGTCLISDRLTVNNPEAFSSDKIVFVGSSVWECLKQENDGRWFYGTPVLEQHSVADEDGIVSYADVIKVDEDGNAVLQYGSAPIANSSNVFVEETNASEIVDKLLENIKDASDTLSSYNGGEGKVIYLEFTGSIYSDTDQSRKILECYDFLRNNPDYSMLVNVKINTGENTFNFNGGNTWDADVASRIVFNFYGDTNPENAHITIGDGFLGTILAPSARVSNASTFCGAVYSPKVVIANGEPHMAAYNAMTHSYSALYEDNSSNTTPVVTTTPPETTVEEPEVTTVPEETTPASEETTEDTATEETTTVTSLDEETEAATSTSAPETTTEVVTTTEPVVTTTPAVTTTPIEVTTTEPPVVTTTPVVTTSEPVVTTPEVTTTTPAVTTTPIEVTTDEPVVTTTTPAVTTTEPVVTTTTISIDETGDVNTTDPAETTVPEEVTISAEETSTTPEEDADVTVPEDVTTVPTEEVTQPEEPGDTSVPNEAPEVTTTTTIIIEIEEDVPLNLITIDEDVPLGDKPMSTGVESHVGIFVIVGASALTIGVGAQVYSVLLKKKN